jgi:hypothetical protein
MNEELQKKGNNVSSFAIALLCTHYTNHLSFLQGLRPYDRAATAPPVGTTLFSLIWADSGNKKEFPRCGNSLRSNDQTRRLFD